MKISNISVECIGHFGSDATVVNAARVSFAKECLEMGEKDVGLINYLAKHKHTSPFNHAFLSFRVKAPIFVARQLVKHKFLPWNEVSRRYVDDEPEFYCTDYFRSRAKNVKQGSSAEANILLENYIAQHSSDCLYAYNELLSFGVCAEQARMVLPQNMMTEWIWSGTLGAFLDMLRLRLDNHAQKESRDVAQLIYGYVQGIFPVSTQATLQDVFYEASNPL